MGTSRVKTELPKTLHGLVKLSDTETYDLTANVTQGVVPAAPASPGGKAAVSSTTKGITAFSAIGLAFLGAAYKTAAPLL